MRSENIEVTVHADGRLQVEANGFKGAGCEQATRFLEEALGRAASRRRKPDYHRANTLKGERRQRLGRGET